MKEIKVFVLVNTLSVVNSFVYFNHIEFFSYCKSHLPHVKLFFFAPHRMSIDMARNQAARMALENECDYLLFLDDDVLVPKNSLEKLLAADKRVIAGLVIIRGYPFNVMAFKYNETKNLSFFNKLPKKNGRLVPVVPCDAVGFSLCLIKTEVLKKTSEPYFVTGAGSTEDVYFCLKSSRELKDKNLVWLETSVQCGHLLNSEPVEWHNREELKKLYKKLMPEDKKREDAYIRQNVRNLSL